MGLVSADINGCCVILEYETEFQAEIAVLTHEFGVTGAARKLGVRRNCLHYWLSGGTPSDKKLKKVHEFINAQV